ncbi:MAG TPA: hypothetical protein VKY85_08860 [Candidatus Angelobacter sp.]|nr:hypothetical protein [Candidatus Angelobacter sp.]
MAIFHEPFEYLMELQPHSAAVVASQRTYAVEPAMLARLHD